MWQEKYEIDIQIDKDKVQSLGLTLSQISNAIRSSNKNQPLGTYELWWLNYDFRIQWEYTDLQDLMQTSISNNAGYDLKLQDIATMSMDYQDDAIVSYGSYKNLVTMRLLWHLTREKEAMYLILLIKPKKQSLR